MDGYSRLEGTTSIAPISEKSWTVRKQSRTPDRYGRDRKKGQGGNGERKEEEIKAVSSGISDEKRDGEPIPRNEDTSGYGRLSGRARKSRNIDLII